MDENNKDPKNTPAQDGGTPNPSDNGGKKDGDQGNDTPKSFTQEDLDRIAAKTRKEEKEKADKALADAVAKAKEEGERLAKLDEETRNKELRQKEQAEFEAKQKELDLRAARYDGIDKLTELKLPTKFIDVLINPDKEKMMENIENFAKEWASALDEAKKEALKGKTPPAPNGGNSKAGQIVTVF